ncbi:lysophospholipid acyltransferase family protein [Nocardioides sp. LHG3406-4]|uniref:lysophospholipid acyltransferase family protein n=1 Tax=Nocardioides sp. LHG3406-4 TaxID=2804575 RepID=UPI003CFA5157
MRDLTYPAIIATAKTAFRALGNSFQLTGTENVPREGGALLVYNHISYVDFVYGGFAANPSGRLVRFMAKRELFDHKISGPLMRSMHHIEVDRGEGLESYDRALEYLRAGELVGIFPEATISRALELKEFKSGAVRIAAAVGVPLIPVVLWGTQRMLTKDHPRDLSRGHTIAITVGEPIQVDSSDPVGETRRLRATMTRMLDDTIAAYPAEEQPPGAWWLPARHGGSAPTLDEAVQLDAEEKRARARKRAERRAGKKKT